jgi:hypothetical protein
MESSYQGGLKVKGWWQSVTPAAADGSTQVQPLSLCVKSPIPFRPRLNNTSVYWLNSKVHPGVMAVKGEKELSKQG